MQICTQPESKDCPLSRHLTEISSIFVGSGTGLRPHWFQKGRDGPEWDEVVGSAKAATGPRLSYCLGEYFASTGSYIVALGCLDLSKAVMSASCLSVSPISSRPSNKTCFRNSSISNLRFSPCVSLIVWLGRSAVSE